MPPSAEDEIINFLAESDVEQNAYSIARAIGKSYGYTRNILTKLVDEGKIVRVRRGWYAHKDTIYVKPNFTMRPLKLHGLKIMTKRRRGVPFPDITNITQGANYTLHRHRRNHSIVYNEVWRERLITVTYHPDHTILVDLRCSDNPVNFNEFDAFTGWLEGRFPQIPLGAWEVLQAGFNWDVVGMQLDGIESVTMRILKDVWYRMYNKRADVLRIEAHTNIRIGLTEALQALEGALDNIEKQVEEKIMVMRKD